MVVSLAARLAATAGKAGLAGLGGLRAARPLAGKAGSAALNLLKGVGNQASRFGKGFSQQAKRSASAPNLGRNYTGKSAAAGRMAQPLAAGGSKVLKATADDIANITQSVLKGAGNTNTAAQAAAVKKAIITKYPNLGEVATKLAARIRSGKKSLAGLDITGVLKSSPAFVQSLGSSVKSGIQTLATSPAGQKVAGSRIGQGSKNLFDRANKATNPLTKNQAADDAFGSVLASGRNIGSSIGSGVGNQFNRLKSGVGSLRSQPSSFGEAGKYMGGYTQQAGAGGLSKAARASNSTGNPFKPFGVNLPELRPYGVKDFIPNLGGALGSAGKKLKGLGSFTKKGLIAGGVGTAGLMYGPDFVDMMTSKSPEKQLRQGVGSLVGTEENRRRSLGDLGALYAQGELGNAIGTPGARNLSQQQMRQYLGGSIFGDEGYANIPMRSGEGMFGGEGSPTMAGDIFNNPARESIMRTFGTQMNDEEIMEKYAEILDKQRKEKSLDAEDLQFLMMFEALSKPTNLPTDQFRRNQGFETQRAYNDVQNQLGGQFEVIDYNELYPTYAQPQTAINAMANGGEVARRVPDVSFSRYAQGGVANLMNGGAANGPGTGTSDSIPAMLSDGEFVMTADAVREMGNGDRKDGVRKMYDLMNNLEGK